MTLIASALMAGCTQASGDAAVFAGPEGAASVAQEPSTLPTSAAAFGNEVTQAQMDALEQGASDYQLALIDEIAAQGSVSYELAKDAAMRTVDCINDAGGDASYTESSEPGAGPLPGFLANGDPENEAAALALIDTCDYQEAHWVNYLYQVQPDFLAWQAVIDERRLDARIECLEDKGIDLPADADWNLVTGEIHELPEPDLYDCVEAGM
ncbi:hypothetical protein [Demequina sediminicola]|uniref:hypothetical protein n=1 Tax=Demequina sediminicola TaxID=1095026 RepID=UPI00128DB496|nr:hypothetical protein [Demequina sediminicola]